MGRAVSAGDFTVRGRPPGEWPGIPGAAWGMGSRVIVRTHSMGELAGLVVGAVSTPDAGAERWRIFVRLDVNVETAGPKAAPSVFLPSEILRLAD